jgi:hypothetical protein
MLAAWDLHKTIVFLVPVTLVVIAVVAWLFLRKTIRTRLRVGRQLKEDPDINEWLVVFNWTRKALYLPTIVASFAAAIAMCFLTTDSAGARGVGGCWLAVFLLNFLVDEYEMSIKLLLILLLCALLLGLWLHLMGWLGRFFELFKRLGIRIDAAGYLVLGVIFLVAVVIAWVRGLFYYVAITPNYLNIQVGPTETGEQISREEYSTRLDTGDFLERIQGFGRIIITFADQRRQPVSLLVGRVGKKAATLESIRGKLALDRYQARREGTTEILP